MLESSFRQPPTLPISDRADFSFAPVRIVARYRVVGESWTENLTCSVSSSHRWLCYSYTQAQGRRPTPTRPVRGTRGELPRRLGVAINFRQREETLAFASVYEQTRFVTVVHLGWFPSHMWRGANATSTER